MNLPLFIGLRYSGAKRSSHSVSFLVGVSMVGLAVGVSLLILVLSVMNGFERELKERILGLVPQAALFHRDGIEDWQILRVQLQEKSDVLAASPFVQVSGLVSQKNNTVFVSLYGFDPKAEESVSLINQFVSSTTLARIQQNEAVILLGKSVAERLKVEAGDKVLVLVPDKQNTASAPRLTYLDVAEIIESKTELDTSLALTSLSRAAALTDSPDRVSGIRLHLDDMFDAPSIMYHTTLEMGPGYYSSNWTRTHGNLYQAIQMSKNLVGLLMSMIVAIAAFNVVTTLVLVVIDKQGDIAILRTMGCKSLQIMAIFVAQGIAIAILGIGSGVVLGCLFSLGIESFVGFVENIFNVQFLNSDTYPLTYLPTEIRLSDIFKVVSTATILSLLATIYPAWKASRVQPAVALRYE